MSDDTEMTNAVIESADAYLNGELGYAPYDTVTAAEYAKMEARRFENMLRGYLIERIEAGDYNKDWTLP